MTTKTAPKTAWTKEVLLGYRKSDKTAIYLSAPSWDCEWYWGFGYLGNKNEHYHLSGYANEGGWGQHRNISMYDALVADYDLSPAFGSAEPPFFQRNKLWTFCELMSTAYTLKEMAEVYNRGGSHYAKNPCQELLKNKDEYERINYVLLPAIFDEVAKLLA